MLHCVLHERLHDHRRHACSTHVVVDAHVDGQARSKACPFDLEVGTDELELFVEERPLALAPSKRVPEYVGELFDRAVRDGWILVDEPRNGVQRIEEEMRIDLRPQRLQLRAARVQRQLTRPLILLLLAALKPEIVDHRREDVGQRREERNVLAEVGRFARTLAQQNPAG